MPLFVFGAETVDDAVKGGTVVELEVMGEFMDHDRVDNLQAEMDELALEGNLRGRLPIDAIAGLHRARLDPVWGANPHEFFVMGDPFFEKGQGHLLEIGFPLLFPHFPYVVAVPKEIEVSAFIRLWEAFDPA